MAACVQTYLNAFSLATKRAAIPMRMTDVDAQCHTIPTLLQTYKGRGGEGREREGGECVNIVY